MTAAMEMRNDKPVDDGNSSETVAFNGQTWRVVDRDQSTGVITKIAPTGEIQIGTVRSVVLPIGRPGVSIYVDGVECKILDQRWDKHEYLHQEGTVIYDSAGRHGLPEYVTYRHNCRLEIEKPDGTRWSLGIFPPTKLKIRRFQPVAVLFTPPPITKIDQIRRFTQGKAIVQFAKFQYAVNCNAERLHASTPALPPQNRDTESPTDLLSVPEAASYAGVTDRTIRTWLSTNVGTGPMLVGVIGKSRLRRIPRSSLTPYRKKR